MCERAAYVDDDGRYEFGRQITHLCYQHYRSRVSKNGKPQKHREWTLLAAVVQSLHSEKGNNSHDILSLLVASKYLRSDNNSTS